jgi:preprotein translocase subunit SecA
MARIGMGEGVPIEHNMVTKAIHRAQKQVEGHNFTIRKHLLEYDDVMNKQRETIYTQRREILEGKDMKAYVEELVETLLDWFLDQQANKEKPPDEWDRAAFTQALRAQFGLSLESLGIDWDGVIFDELREKVLMALRKLYEEKERMLGPGAMRQFERIILLQVIDVQWKDHLLGMDYLKEGIGLRGYGQRDPLVEYKKESFDMFQAMLDRIEEDTVRYLYLFQPVVEQEMPVRRPERPAYRQGPPPPPSVPKGGGRQVRATIPGRRKK